MDDRTWDIFAVQLTKVSLRNLDKEEFDSFIYQTYINGRADILPKVLTSKKKKNRYLRCLITAYLNGKVGTPNSLETKFLQKLQFDDLPDLIKTEAHKYGVNINYSNYQMRLVKIMDDLKKMFQSGDRYGFENYATEKLKGNDGVFQHKIKLVNLLVDDPVYAYCWTKYINLKRRIPKFVREVKNVYTSDVEAFIRRVNGKVPTAKSDKTESCEVFDKTYKLITVTTPKGLNNFFRTYLVESKPKILGIDVESIPYINQVSTIQLATTDWCCIIDVHILSKHLSDNNWKIFFERIFDPEITRIGFALASDYYFIGNTFPYISSLMQTEKSKSLCLKKLVDIIVKNQEAKDAVLHGRPLASVSLSNVAKAILGIELNKDMQRSDWSQRPLTNEQKIYAVTDAVVVLLIKEKIENDLKKNLGPAAASKIIEDSFVSMKAEKDATVEKLTKNLGGVSV